jgi:hypothetical protein
MIARRNAAVFLTDVGAGNSAAKLSHDSVSPSRHLQGSLNLACTPQYLAPQDFFLLATTFLTMPAGKNILSII